jgi:acetolactate synthase-1/2/3 large subunit
VRHEQGAGTPAEGYATATARSGVCMATSGPGATNLVTPIADAHMDSVPIVAITGQVPERRHRHRRLPGGRHPRHHDADHQAQLPRHRPGRHPATIAEAFHIASTGRPGPVLVDISKDALQARTTFSWPVEMHLPGYRPVTKPHGKQIREAARLLSESRGRCSTSAVASCAPERRTSCACSPSSAARRSSPRSWLAAPSPTATRSTSACPGMHGSVAAVTALQKADLIVSLGARFDDRVTGQLSTFAPRGEGGARRHRPGRDLQEPYGRRADRR